MTPDPRVLAPGRGWRSKSRTPKILVKVSQEDKGSVPQGGGGGGGTLIFSVYVGSDPYSSPQKNIRNFKNPNFFFEILATPKNIPHSVPLP